MMVFFNIFSKCFFNRPVIGLSLSYLNVNPSIITCFNSFPFLDFFISPVLLFNTYRIVVLRASCSAIEV